MTEYDLKDVTGEITNVDYFKAPNDTTLDEQDGHIVTINNEQYWLDMSHQSPTAKTFEDVDGTPLEIEGAYIEAQYREIEGRRGQIHRILENVQVLEAEEACTCEDVDLGETDRLQCIECSAVECRKHGIILEPLEDEQGYLCSVCRADQLQEETLLSNQQAYAYILNAEDGYTE